MYSRIILFILFPLFGFSQAPQKINFQSILRNTNGEVVANKSVSIKISILSGSISGSSVYGETHTKTTDASGLISLQIGNGTVLSGVFANIAWGSAAHFIKLEADFNGGSNYVALGTLLGQHSLQVHGVIMTMMRQTTQSMESYTTGTPR